LATVRTHTLLELPPTPPYLIIIDALDEIKDNKGPSFLKELLKAIKEYDLRGFKFLVTSRPDPKVAELCEAYTISRQSVVIAGCRAMGSIPWGGQETVEIRLVLRWLGHWGKLTKALRA
jgi:hypothetical protein